MAYISKYSGQEMDAAISSINEIEETLINFINIIYPVGSIYTSTKSTSPAILFGGTWTQIKDTFLLTAGDTYTVGSTGGNATHTHTSAAHTHTTAGHVLTENEMPRHAHGYSSWQDGYPTAITATSTYRTPLVLISAGLDGNPVENTFCLNVGGDASHSHGDTGSTTPGATGSSSSLPPYRVVYAWERTA